MLDSDNAIYCGLADGGFDELVDSGEMEVATVFPTMFSKAFRRFIISETCKLSLGTDVCVLEPGIGPFFLQIQAILAKPSTMG